MKKLLVTAFVVGVIVGGAFPVLGTAAVHFPNDNTWLDDNYEIDSLRSFPFEIGNPGSNFFSRAQDGAAAWSAISGSGLDFVYQQQRQMGTSLHVCNIDHDETWVMDYWTSSWDVPSSGIVPDGTPLGVADLCGPSAGNHDHVLIKINHDDDIDWEWTAWGSVDAGEYDLHGLMVHEFGHSVGGIDFYGGTECTNLYTMCGAVDDGDEYQRTITQHEKDDVAAKY